jgi:putative iron-dependent peroxidase
MTHAQPGILAPTPKLARYLTFSLKPGAQRQNALSQLAALTDGDALVVGIGQPTVVALNRRIDGLRIFPTNFGAGLVLPSTSAALWCWLRGADRGDLLHLTRKVINAVASAFTTDPIIDAFEHAGGRDLSGYVDGTENPQGAKAIAAGIIGDGGDGLDGGSFVAVQQWEHDFARFEAMPNEEQDNSVGRRKSDNKELTDSPPSSHVKRTAQESFSPEAFILRRSMPWSDGTRGGLNFVAFGKSFDAFEAQLKRMVGAEDGITDALFKFTTPISGSYFWCPPMQNGKLDLRALGL